MNQELEIEFKNLLTKEEFIALVDVFVIDRKQFQTQVNYYFDTNQFALKARKSALRIRFKRNTYTLTLKQTIPEGILETHQSLSENEANSMLENKCFPDGDINNLLTKDGLDPETFQYLGKLTTKRAEISHENGILVLDHSKYLHHEDYELEYEVKNREHGHVSFIKLLQHYQIPIRKTENKIQRFFNKAKGE